MYMTGTKKAKDGTASMSTTTNASIHVGNCIFYSRVMLFPISGVLRAVFQHS